MEEIDMRETIDLRKVTLQTVHTELELLEQDGSTVARVKKVDKTTPDENTYVKLADCDFHNGIIEVDVCGSLLPDAPDYARGFIGIAFRIQEQDQEFESFYVRPTNGRGCEDPVRAKHGGQYFAYPGYTFSYFREFNIEKYECAVPDIALNEWSHIKAVIEDNEARFYVNGEERLIVPDLKHGASARGSLGLYVDIGTDGYFKNLSVEKKD
jgi:hypothetical protein